MMNPRSQHAHIIDFHSSTVRHCDQTKFLIFVIQRESKRHTQNYDISGQSLYLRRVPVLKIAHAIMETCSEVSIWFGFYLMKTIFETFRHRIWFFEKNHISAFKFPLINSLTFHKCQKFLWKKIRQNFWNSSVIHNNMLKVFSRHGLSSDNNDFSFFHT